METHRVGLKNSDMQNTDMQNLKLKRKNQTKNTSQSKNIISGRLE